MRKSACLFALLTLSAAPAAAQRWAAPVGEMNDSILSSQLHQQRPAVVRCASAQDSGAYLVEVRANVRRGARPSSMHNARIRVSVRSRPRDSAFEGCVRRNVRESLRAGAYAVERPSRAHLTFRLNERPDRFAERPPAPSYSAAEVQRVLRSSNRRFAQCLGMAGVPERLTLRVAVDPDGRLMLTNAQVPTGADRGALSCLTRVVGGLRVRGVPRRRVQISHTVAVQNRAY